MILKTYKTWISLLSIVCAASLVFHTNLTHAQDASQRQVIQTSQQGGGLIASEQAIFAPTTSGNCPSPNCPPASSSYQSQFGGYSTNMRTPMGHGAACPDCQSGTHCPQCGLGLHLSGGMGTPGCPGCAHLLQTLSALEQHKMAMWGRLMSHHANKPPVGDWYPTHYHTFYQKKRNYQYPNNKIPAGVIQYPYYTLRGPTDFFMK